MRKALTSLLLVSSLPTHANVLQYFTGISYNNPAELVKIKKTEFIVGSTGFNVNADFTGSVLNFNTFQYDSGSGNTNTSSLLPYMRIAKRANDKWVFGVDMTQPFHSNLNWGDDSFTRYASTQTLMRDIDISPRFAYSVSQQFHVGAGLNFNVLKNNEANWAMPSGQTTYATLINKSSGFGVGFNAGLSYVMNPTNIFGLTYYSKIPQNTNGYSYFNGTVNNDLSFNFHMPATTVANYVHIFNQDWLVSAQAFFTQWDVNQYARYKNTAAPPPLDKDFTFTMQYNSSFAYLVAVRKQCTQKLGLTLLGMIDNGPEQDNLRTINFPSDTQYFLALSGDYQINETTTLQLLYGHGYSKTQIRNQVTVGPQTMPFTTGDVKINADVVDFRIKVAM